MSATCVDSKDERCEVLFLMHRTSKSGQVILVNVGELELDAESKQTDKKDRRQCRRSISLFTGPFCSVAQFREELRIEEQMGERVLVLAQNLLEAAIRRRRVA
jgi:hypothetical protein